MIPYFRSLGESIERAWTALDYDEDAFPQLAQAELERVPPGGEVEASEIIDWVFGPTQGLLQPPGQELFGQPPVMVYQAPRFYIEVLFWLAGTTGIHEHAFSGALAVLAGSSVHSHWRFEPLRPINSRMCCGRLERLTTEVLRAGDIRQILPGDRLIHQLFHLEVPSVTIVVRTNIDRRHVPQLEYLPPGLAIDNEDREGLRTRRMIFLESMTRGHFSGLAKHTQRLAAEGDLETLYHALSLLTRLRADAELLEEFYRILHRRYGAIAGLLREVCEEQRRIRLVTSLRAKVLEPQPRFLLALLMLMPDRDAILETIRMQHPDLEPAAALESWLEQIPGKKTLGFDLDSGANRLIFRGLMEGSSEDELLRSLGSKFSDDAIAAQRQRLLEHASTLAESDLLRPLFSESPFQQNRPELWR